MDEKDNIEIDEVKMKIKDAFALIEKIPDFRLDNVKGKDIKIDLSNALKDLQKRTEGIAKINENLGAVRREIINPVNDIIEKSYQKIKKSSEEGNKLSKFGFVVGIVGLMLTVFNFFPWNKLIQQKKHNQVTIEQNIFENQDLDEISAIIKGQSFNNEISIDSSKLLKEIHEIENMINLNSIIDTRAIHERRLKLIVFFNQLYEKNIKDNEILSTITYGIIICDSVIDDWERIFRLSYTIINGGISSNTTYESAIQVYRAEALIKTKDLLFESRKIYRKILNQNNLKNIQFLSPNNRKLEFIEVVSKRRLKQIESILYKKKIEIFVYDSKSENRSQGLVEKFKKNGFVNVKNKGNWNVKFDFPFIYYRNLDDVKSSVNTQITSYLNDSFLYKEHFKKSKIKRIQQLFKQNQNLTFVIVL